MRIWITRAYVVKKLKLTPREINGMDSVDLRDCIGTRKWKIVTPKTKQSQDSLIDHQTVT